ncbi:MAG: hypothetical protein AB7S26_19470 [Sandaracinaceae bacterium]
MRAVLAAIVVSTACSGDPGDVTVQPEPPRAEEYRSERVHEAIEAAAEVVQTRGFGTQDDAWRGFLVEHTADVRERSMRSGTCYVVLAAGSAAIRELNVRIYDGEGGEVVEDGIDGPNAALRFCPSQSGVYYVTVRASAGSGLIEMRTFRGPTGLAIRVDDLFQPTPAESNRELR